MTRAPAGGVNPPGPPPAMSWGAHCPVSLGTEGGGLVVVMAGRAAAPGPASCPAVAPAQSPPVASAPTRPATHSRPGSPAPGSPALDPPWRPAACPGCGLCSGSFWNQTLWAPSRPVPPHPAPRFPCTPQGPRSSTKATSRTPSCWEMLRCPLLPGQDGPSRLPASSLLVRQAFGPPGPYLERGRERMLSALPATRAGRPRPAPCADGLPGDLQGQQLHSPDCVQQ